MQILVSRHKIVIVSTANLPQHSQSMANHVLIGGYIRELCHNKTVPLNIHQAIYGFYCIKSRFLYYIRRTKHNYTYEYGKTYNIYITDINNTNHQTIKCENPFIPLFQNTVPDSYTVNSTRLYIASNIQLPSKLRNKIISHNSNNQNSDKYNAIFQVGGQRLSSNTKEVECYAMIFNATNFPNNDIFHWRLPNISLPLAPMTRNWRDDETHPGLPPGLACNSISFSDKYGLFSVGGNQKKCVSEHYDFDYPNNRKKAFNLSKLDRNEWKDLNDMEYDHKHPSSIIFEDKLMVVGGENSNIVELYNISSKKWNQIASCYKKQMCNSGICYDNYGKCNVYVGEDRKVECYDINKNKWINLADTNMVHKWNVNPIMWIDNVNNSLLYIASTTFRYEAVEMLDLRSNVNKWMVKHQNISKQVFQTAFSCKTQNSWLLTTD